MTVNDDRAKLSPWGIGGGLAGGRSGKWIVRADGTREELPSKVDNVPVRPGDRIVFRTAGAGGWGDPLERPAWKVERDVRRRLVSAESARRDYGVVVGDEAATGALRTELRDARGEPSRFDFGELPVGMTPPSQRRRAPIPAMATSVADTGRKGWLAVAAAVGTIVLVYMAIFAVPPLGSTFTDDFGLSNGRVGLLMSVYLIMYAAFSLPAGALGDRFGNARVMAVALVVAGIASIVFATTESYGVWLAMRAVIGACTAVMFTPGAALAVQGLPRERSSSAAGYVIAAISVGTTIAFLLTRPIESALGWRWPFVVYGILCLAGVLLLVPLLGERGARTSGGLLGVADLRAVITRPFLVYASTLFLVVFVGYGVITWTAPFLDEVGGFSTGEVTIAITILGAATIPASLVGGWLADRLQRPLTVMGLGMGISVPVAIFAFAGESSYAIVTVLATIAAFGSIGTCGPMWGIGPTMVAPERAGLAIGTATTIGMSGAVASTYLGGVLVDATGDYDATWLVFAAVALVALALMGPATAVALRRARP
ncbi:MAG: MFS transporter [Thermoleophilia bacterium]